MSDKFKRGDIVQYVSRGNANEPPSGAIGIVTGISPMGGPIINWISHQLPDGCGWCKENLVKIAEAEGVE